MKILHAMATADGRWRVEIVQKGAKVQYRMLCNGEIFKDWAAIGTIEHYLRQDGIDMADLERVEPWRPLAGPGA